MLIMQRHSNHYATQLLAITEHGNLTSSNDHAKTAGQKGNTIIRWNVSMCKAGALHWKWKRVATRLQEHQIFFWFWFWKYQTGVFLFSFSLHDTCTTIRLIWWLQCEALISGYQQSCRLTKSAVFYAHVLLVVVTMYHIVFTLCSVPTFTGDFIYHVMDVIFIFVFPSQKNVKPVAFQCGWSLSSHSYVPGLCWRLQKHHLFISSGLMGSFRCMPCWGGLLLL